MGFSAQSSKFSFSFSQKGLWMAIMQYIRPHTPSIMNKILGILLLCIISGEVRAQSFAFQRRGFTWETEAPPKIALDSQFAHEDAVILDEDNQIWGSNSHEYMI